MVIVPKELRSQKVGGRGSAFRDDPGREKQPLFKKAAKAAKIATDRPEAIWQPWQPWQPWQCCTHLGRQDTRSFLSYYPFMRSGHRAKVVHVTALGRNRLKEKVLEVVRANYLPNFLLLRNL
jgi:hypothetical protein